MKFLIARWNNWHPEAAGAGPPDSVRWSDGTTATVADYRRHMDDTHRSVVVSPKCLEKHYYPGLIANVQFDAKGRHWAVSGKGIEPTALCLSDPFATDEQIAAEMFTLPLVYKHHVVRAADSALVQ